MRIYGLVCTTVKGADVVDIRHQEDGVQVYYETREQAEREREFWQLRSYAQPRYGGEAEVYRIAVHDLAIGEDLD